LGDKACKTAADGPHEEALLKGGRDRWNFAFSYLLTEKVEFMLSIGALHKDRHWCKSVRRWDRTIHSKRFQHRKRI